MSLADGPSLSSIHARVADLFADADARRMRALDEMIRAHKAEENGRPRSPVTIRRKRNYEPIGERAPGQTHCAMPGCKRPLAKWNRSGYCTPCRWEGKARKTGEAAA